MLWMITPAGGVDLGVAGHSACSYREARPGRLPAERALDDVAVVGRQELPLRSRQGLRGGALSGAIQDIDCELRRFGRAVDQDRIKISWLGSGRDGKYFAVGPQIEALLYVSGDGDSLASLPVGGSVLRSN